MHTNRTLFFTHKDRAGFAKFIVPQEMVISIQNYKKCTKIVFHVYLLRTGHSPDSDPNHSQSDPRSEPIFVDPSRSSEIDSQPGGSVRNPICRTGPPGYIGWRNKIPRNRFLGIPLLFTNTGSDICTNYSQSNWA